MDKIDIPHNETGHINTCIRDQESDITSFGKHNRLLVFKDLETGLYEIREDIKWDLALSTEDDRKRILSGWQRLHPKGVRLQLSESRLDDDGKCIWHIYKSH